MNLDPATAVGSIVGQVTATVLGVGALAAVSWFLGPLKWFWENWKLRKFVLGREFRFVFNSQNLQHKILTFHLDGTIAKGRNSNEFSWKVKRGKLEFHAADGQLYSRFKYNNTSGRLEHTNDLDCRSLPNQYLEFGWKRVEPPAKNSIDSIDTKQDWSELFDDKLTVIALSCSVGVIVLFFVAINWPHNSTLPKNKNEGMNTAIPSFEVEHRTVSDQMDPTTLAKLRPIELGILIKNFMLSAEGQQSWEMLAESKSIKWTTNGIERTREGAVRVGQARVRVHGKATTRLEQALRELAWDVAIESTLPPKFAPQNVKIEPGQGCFGEGGSGCEFDLLQALRIAGITATLRCSRMEMPAYGHENYQVRTKGKRPMELVLWVSAGSGGATNWIKLYWRLEDIASVDTC